MLFNLVTFLLKYAFLFIYYMQISTDKSTLDFTTQEEVQFVVYIDFVGLCS